MGQEVFVRGLTRRTTRAGSAVYGKTNVAKVDLEDGPTRRSFQNKSTTIVVLPDYVVTMQRAGSLPLAGTASGMVFRAPRAMKVWGVAAQVGTIPAGAGTTLLDVKYVAGTAAPTAAGTSIFTDSTRRPSFQPGTVHLTATPLGGSTNAGYPGTGTVKTFDLAAGDYLRVEIAGTAATPGSDLTVQIFGY